MFDEFNILKYFFEEPNREFGVRELSRLSKLSPATISKKLEEFYKKNILIYRKERIYDLYKSNLNSNEYLDLKIYYNIRLIRESGLIEGLNQFYLKPTIILFGSASKGLDTETSDFDFVVISENKKSYPTLNEFNKKFKKTIQIFNIKNLNELKNEYLINNVLNGIVLQGEINGFK